VPIGDPGATRSRRGIGRALSRAALVAVIVYAALLAWTFLVPPRYTPHTAPLPDSFAAFLAQRLAVSAAFGVRPGSEERLVRHAPGRTREVVLYLHGFGASRGEGEWFADRVAAARGANLYYLRLPGHGTDADDHAAHDFGEYLDTAEEAFQMTSRLGDRVILVGTSTGGLLATWLAARHPDRVRAVILASPLYAFRDPMSVLITVPGGMTLIHALYGRTRDTRSADPEHRDLPGWERIWTLDQRYDALPHLDRLRRYAARPAFYDRVSAPTLLFYFYRDARHQDPTASVPAMRAAFARYGREAKRSPLDRMVAVADGAHVLLCGYVRTDKTLILRESLAFLDRAAAAEGDSERTAGPGRVTPRLASGRDVPLRAGRRRA
jgi:pimeloyl-ACP methyl ester carboxylesterase